MEVIKLNDLRKYRADRIAVGNCDYSEMQALAWFIGTVQTYEIEEDDNEDNDD